MKNSKTCLVDAAAHIMNIGTFMHPDYEEEYNQMLQKSTWMMLCEQIGHDGSERGFHSQELQDALRVHDIVMVSHELWPAMQVPNPEEPLRPKIIEVYPKEELEQRFVKKLNYGNHGILVHRKSDRVHHALSYQSGSNTAYDVASGEFLPLEDLDVIRFLEFIPL